MQLKMLKFLIIENKPLTAYKFLIICYSISNHLLPRNLILITLYTDTYYKIKKLKTKFEFLKEKTINPIT